MDSVLVQIEIIPFNAKNPAQRAVSRYKYRGVCLLVATPLARTIRNKKGSSYLSELAKTTHNMKFTSAG